MYIGVHFDHYQYPNLLSALKKLNKIKVNAIQIFIGDNHMTTLSKKNKFSKDDFIKIKEYLKKKNIKLNIHGLLSLNYCFPPNSPRFKWGLDNLIHDLNICKSIDCQGVVIHMGSYKTPSINIGYKDCLKNFVDSLHIVLSKTKKSKIILETSVNRPNTVGGTIESLKELYDSINEKDKKRIKFCIDTCHIFSAGYPIQTIEGCKQYFEDFDRLIGLKHISLIHLNDSKEPFNSHKDRHESIGKGYIFNKKLGGDQKVLKEIIKIAKKNKINIILETNPQYFNKEIKLLKSLNSSNSLSSNKFKLKKKVLKENKKIKGGKKDYKEKIIEIFEQIKNFHQSLGKEGNMQTKFRISSYQKAINSLKSLNKPIFSIEDVEEIPNIGKGFKEKIDEIIKTGTLKMFEEIENDPQMKAINLFQKIWGIGVERSRELVLKNKIYTIEELRDKVEKGKIELNEQQLLGLKYFEDLNERIPKEEIKELTKYFKKMMKKYKIKIENGGSYHLGKKDSGDIDLIFSIKDYNQHTDYAKFELVDNIIHELSDKKILLNILSRGNKKIICIIKNPLNNKIHQMDIMFIDEKDLPWYILYFGSGVEFSKKIRKDAIEKGYKLSEKGLFDRKTGKRIDFNPKTEKNIFNYLKIKYVKPKNRVI